jgi:hypothetical protein
MIASLGTLTLLAAGSADVAARVGSGVIEGGWDYVYAAYAITWAVIIAYGLSLWIRRPSAMTSSKEDRP